MPAGGPSVAGVSGISGLTAWLAGGRLAFARMPADTSREHTRAMLVDRARRLLASRNITVEISGVPPPRGQGCVVVYNETSFADVFAFNATVWDHIDVHAVDELYGRLAFGAKACSRLGVELVPRKDRAASDRLISRMAEAVRAGHRVAWGGEGGFSGGDHVRRFKIGAALIALRAGAPLVPLLFRGGHAAMPLRGLRASPGMIRVRFGSPMSTDGMSESDARMLADRAHAAAVGLYGELAPGAPG